MTIDIINIVLYDKLSFRFSVEKKLEQGIDPNISERDRPVIAQATFHNESKEKASEIEIQKVTNPFSQ
jgi:hypothetical protein